MKLTSTTGKLYIGYFNQTKNGKLAIYHLDNSGKLILDPKLTNTASPARTIQTYDQVQGMSLYEDKILLSQSYGAKDSKLFIFDNNLDDDNFDLDKDDAIASLTLPPYLEQIIGRNDKVYLLFESALPTSTARCQTSSTWTAS